MSLYFDASAIVPLFVTESGSVAMDRFVIASEGPWLVSDFAAGEVTAAFGRMVRENRVAPDHAQTLLTMFDGWRLTDCIGQDTGSGDVRLASIFVRRFDLKLRLPDAIHAASCQRLGATLVTFDNRLANAATALGIAAQIPV